MRAHILIGLPACGKSTWREANASKDAVVISSDDLIEQYASENGITYDQAFSTAIGVANKKCKHDFNWAVVEGKQIIIDRTNLTPKSRKEWTSILNKHGYHTVAVLFASPYHIEVNRRDAAIKEHNRRLASRPGKTIPDYVMDQMVRNFSVPNDEEGFSRIEVVDTFA